MFIIFIVVVALFACGKVEALTCFNAKDCLSGYTLKDPNIA
ncbi:hypothetical protein M7I_0126 [Glarea lozoyensis 74030]|uniref:Uncharacterized protein n=1 Tax=Glarea lozoyensis (strain ATCC 74030 / MF5533) TaxID=1104152 RepID=H0ECI7_GLAL7|nr:hypothetical protein M7I_0126 [Glarea lozoyensis 74030]